jgi:hypothetical protein
MKAEQISIFLENRTGRLSEVAEILALAQVNIRALSLADTSDFGILRLIVDDNEKAEKALRDNGLTAQKNEVVAVEVEDRPGGLHRILAVLKNAGINVEYMYAFIKQTGDRAIMIFRFNRPDEAIRVLADRGFTVIGGDRLHTL